MPNLDYYDTITFGKPPIMHNIITILQILQIIKFRLSVLLISGLLFECMLNNTYLNTRLLCPPKERGYIFLVQIPSIVYRSRDIAA